MFEKDTDIKNSKRSKINNSKGFSYDDNSHTYTMDGVKLLSSTTWIGTYKEPFKRNMISAMVAKSNKKKNKGLTDPALIREYWTSYGKRLANLGTAGHEFCRQYYLDKDNKSSKPLVSYERNAKKLMDALMKKYNILEMEKPRGIKSYMIGYTIDIILEDKKTGDLFIGDFKFGKYMTKEQYKEGKGGLPTKMREPFKKSEFRNVTLDSGSIQMAMYKYFYERMNNVKIKDCILFHIDGAEEHYGEKGYKAYRYRNEADKLVKEEIKKQEVKNLDVLMDMI